MALTDTAEYKEMMALVLRYLRPMVESAEKNREREIERDAMRAKDGAEDHGMVFLAAPSVGRYDPAYQNRPVFAFTLNGFEAVMRDDGAVLMWSDETRTWFVHSCLQGTPSARPETSAT